MYQVEVKLRLAESFFRPASGWTVNVHLNPMELARGGRHQPGKAERTASAEQSLRDLGVRIGTHEQYGRIDFAADQASSHRHLIEVEGDSSRSKHEAIYLCLGQLVMAMKSWGQWDHYGIAVPGTSGWLRQLARLPKEVRERLSIDLYVVAPLGHVMQIRPHEDVPRQART
jgi:hypothetical protein